MKLFFCIFLIWASANCSADPDPNPDPDFFNDVKESFQKSEFGRALISVATDVGTALAEKACDALNSGKQKPNVTTSIKKVSLQFTTTCGRKEVNIKRAKELRKLPEFNVKKNTVVFATGFRATPNEEYVHNMAKAYNCRGDTNFVVLNTGDSLKHEYFSSAFRTAKLGEFVAKGLKALGIPANKIHLIGHSLGAQIMGSAGRNYKKLTGKKIQRITGLDPARPCFSPPNSLPRLEKNDAEFVDIIHSNPNKFGLQEPVGHVDFYPAGLVDTQPGCDAAVSCSHNRAIQYYLETVYPSNERTFMGSQCSGFPALRSLACSGPQSPMGYAADRSVRGIHYLPVKTELPFGNEATNAARSIESGSCGLCRKKT